MDKKILESIKSILSTNKKIILIPHSSPDADALGSCLALFHFAPPSTDIFSEILLLHRFDAIASARTKPVEGFA